MDLQNEMKGALELMGLPAGTVTGGNNVPAWDLETIKENRPPAVGWCCESRILVDELGLCQWHGQKSDGRWHPWGQVFLPAPPDGGQ